MTAIRDLDVTQQRMTDREKAIIQVAAALVMRVNPILHIECRPIVQDAIEIVDGCIALAGSEKGGAA